MAKAAYRPDRPIVLVGLMGAGKSTVGRRLARRLHLPFADVDETIEADAGLSIAEMFDRFGEAQFRIGERRTIARLAEGPVQVIATGGGAFVDPATRTLLLDRCITVWLEAEAETLAERVSRRDHRPLLRGKDPLPLLRSLAEQRAACYRQAHIHLRSAAQSPDDMADRIVAALRARAAADRADGDACQPG